MGYDASAYYYEEEERQTVRRGTKMVVQLVQHFFRIGWLTLDEVRDLVERGYLAWGEHIAPDSDAALMQELIWEDEARDYNRDPFRRFRKLDRSVSPEEVLDAAAEQLARRIETEWQATHDWGCKNRTRRANRNNGRKPFRRPVAM
jgi:hypothetical protein